MEHEIVNPYRNAYLLKRPVCKNPFPSNELLQLLEEAASTLFPLPDRRLDYARAISSIRLFKRFLESSRTKELTTDEDLLEEFRISFQDNLRQENGKSYGKGQAARAVDHIRYLFNKYFYPRRLILRKLLGRKLELKYRRFLSLSETTQKLILMFEEDGCKLKARKKYFEDDRGREFFRIQVQRKTEKLSAYNRQSSITSALTVLAILNKTGIEEVRTSDLEKFLHIYDEKHKKETAKTYLVALFSIVGNGISLGILHTNPFDNFLLERRKIRSRRDFISPEEIEKLLSLKSLDWQDAKEVRRRCLTVLLYDTGLRAAAMTKLRLTDLHEQSDGTYQLSIKGQYLKGQKEDSVLHLLFRETNLLLKHWIHVIRTRFYPKTDRLFVSTRGAPLTVSGVRDVVYDCCGTLDICTFKKETPSPHTFRHTLPTLNTEPYGKSLSPRLMQQRLGHMDFETFERIYVHNNPLSELEEYKKLYAKDSAENLFRKISKEDFFRILDCLSAAKVRSVLDVKRAYEHEITAKARDENPAQWNEVFTEEEAISALSSFKVDYRSLRSWGLREGVCRVLDEGGTRRFIYDKRRVSEMVEDYLATWDALKKFLGSRTEFYRRLKWCRSIRIGRSTLLSKNDFLEVLLKDRDRYKIESNKRNYRYAGI